MVFEFNVFQRSVEQYQVNVVVPLHVPVMVPLLWLVDEQTPALAGLAMPRRRPAASAAHAPRPAIFLNFMLFLRSTRNWF